MYDTDWMRSVRFGQAVTNSDASYYPAKGPKGKAGTVMDWGMYNVSTATAGATTTPHIKLGLAADDDAYVLSWDVGVIAIGASNTVRSSLDLGVHADYTSFLALFGVVGRRIPANTQLVLKYIAATGGGAAGVGNIFVDIAWDP